MQNSTSPLIIADAEIALDDNLAYSKSADLWRANNLRPTRVERSFENWSKQDNTVDELARKWFCGLISSAAKFDKAKLRVGDQIRLAMHSAALVCSICS